MEEIICIVDEIRKRYGYIEYIKKCKFLPCDCYICWNGGGNNKILKPTKTFEKIKNDHIDYKVAHCNNIRPMIIQGEVDTIIELCEKLSTNYKKININTDRTYNYQYGQYSDDEDAEDNFVNNFECNCDYVPQGRCFRV